MAKKLRTKKRRPKPPTTPEQHAKNYFSKLVAKYQNSDKGPPVPELNHPKFIPLMAACLAGNAPLAVINMMVVSERLVYGTLEEIFKPRKHPLQKTLVEVALFPDRVRTSLNLIPFVLGQRIYLSGRNGVLMYNRQSPVFILRSGVVTLPADMRKWEEGERRAYSRAFFTGLKRQGHVGPRPGPHAVRSDRYTLTNLVRARRTNAFPSARQWREEGKKSFHKLSEDIDTSYSLTQ